MQVHAPSPYSQYENHADTVGEWEDEAEGVEFGLD